jgi:hypothetical protein
VLYGTLTPLLAGALKVGMFEPAMRSGGALAPLFGSLFGTQLDAGMALVYVVMSWWIVLVGIGGYAFRTRRHVASILPDHDVVTR